MRVIIHPGFHKTGTSSLQACLAANRAALAPYARLVLLDELAAPLRHATRYATAGDPFDLAAFTAAFAQICQTIADTGKTLLISCEGLSGRTPGKKGIVDYRAAVPLAEAMATAVKAVFGGKTTMTLVYTTREPADWMRSAWQHNLSGYRVTQDFETFCAEFSGAADFAQVLSQVAQKLRRAEVISVPLRSVQDAVLGPAEAVLSLLDLPPKVRAGLLDPGRRNAGHGGDVALQMLALNRSRLPDDEIKRRKAALLRPGAVPRQK